MRTRPFAAGGALGPPSAAADVRDPAPDPRSLGSSPVAGRLRLLRVAGLGGSSTLLAGTAHLAGGGELPGLLLSLLLVAAAGTVAVVLTARRCRLPALLAVLGAEQALLHTVLDTSSVPLCSPAAAMPPEHGGAMAMCSTATQLTPVAPSDSHLSLVMVAAHVLATVVTAWLLARGEAALWRLADRVVRAAEPRLTPWPASAPREPALLHPAVLVASVRRGDAPPRGPPARLAVPG